MRLVLKLMANINYTKIKKLYVLILWITLTITYVHSWILKKMNYMINERYYDKEVLNQYTPKQVEDLFDHAYSFNFRFPSFMSALKFFTDYALMNREGNRYLERYEDRVAMTALFLGRGNYVRALNYCTRMMKQRYQPATPTFFKCR